MRWLLVPLLAFLLLGYACQPQAPATIAVVDGDRLQMVSVTEHTPAAILSHADILLGPADKLLFDGLPVAPDANLGAHSGTLQVQRAASLSLNGNTMQTAARTVGEALAESRMSLRLADTLVPPAAAPLTASVIADYRPARELIVQVDGQERRVWSAASSVGVALADAGLPMLGMDFSRPGETEALPTDGQIRIVRVSESVVLTEKPITFQSEYKDSAKVDFGQEQILQPGVQGLSVSRVRIRYEDGQEISRQTELETVVRPPQNRITMRGTRVALKTTTVNGVKVQYWLKLQMYATVYSPCTSGGAGQCSYGTASGLRAGKGIVAVDPGLYSQLNGQRLFIPGYGSAVIGDVGGGYIVEQNTGVSRYRWIDLGFDDNNLIDMTGWITVYFLAPAPAAVPDVLK